METSIKLMTELKGKIDELQACGERLRNDKQALEVSCNQRNSLSYFLALQQLIIKLFNLYIFLIHYEYRIASGTTVSNRLI